jgi:N-acetylglucosamine malate deacetylase 1
MVFNSDTILILAPHTDDGELGCGGTIAKLHSLGKKVYYAAFSTCKKSLPAGVEPDTLEREMRAATAVLGISVEQLVVFDYDVRTFKQERQPILDEMIRLREKIHPDLVLLPCSTDIHQDHQVIYEEGLRAFKNTSMLGYEMPWNNRSFNIGAFVGLDESLVDRKVAALEQYRSQAHQDYLNPAFIRSLASVRGVQSGKKYAEAFEVINFNL